VERVKLILVHPVYQIKAHQGFHSGNLPNVEVMKDKPEGNWVIE